MSKSAETALSLPSRSSSLRQPSHSRVHTVDYHATDYNNYSKAFSEVTAYDNKITPSSTTVLSSLSRSNSTRQIESFGSKLLNAISGGARGPPAAAGLARTKSFHQRAKSLASFVPSLSPSAIEGDSTRKGRPFTPLFSSNSTGRLSIDRLDEDVEDEDREYYNPIMEYKPALTGGDRPSRISNHTENKPQPPPPSQPKKFSWFGGLKQQQPRDTAPTQDQSSADPDLMSPATTLLFPHGALDPEDPASFANLLRNAETLITRLQTAYRQQEQELKTARQEREASAEEAEEADTRARHLKLQLDEMGKKANEQRKSCEIISQELASEKQRRAEESDASSTHLTPKRRPYRDSAGSASTMSSIASDSGFESDYYQDTETDTTAESIASRPMSPVFEPKRWDLPAQPTLRPASRGSSIQGTSCNVDVRVWTYMKEEKNRLENRVKELEGIVDGCLDLVSHA
ncbi:hypothetical protein AAFC00_002980 [Neodothiora populina]